MADKPDKTNKLKARLPRGFDDRAGSGIAATRRMIERIQAVYERYGFDPVETPAIEYTDALGKFLPDQDRPNEGVFSFQDDDEQWLSLRYDLTAPLARYVAEHFDALPKPYRSYRVGWVFRNEKPGPGRFRQFMQFDADTVGSAAPAADAEICMMAADTMEALGIARGDYVVKIWSRKLLDGTMDAAEVPPEKRLTVLRSIDKYDRLKIAGVQPLLDKGRKDESGDFTQGAGLSISANNFITSSIVNLGIGYHSEAQLIPLDILQEAEQKPRKLFDFDAYRARLISSLGARPLPAATESGLSDLEEIHGLIAHAGYEDRIRIDETIVRGLEYYTGSVFEVDLTFEIKDEQGQSVRFGSVGGGGRYDGLIARFRGEAVPATGFSIGVSRLLAALQAINSPVVASSTEHGPVVVTVFDKSRIADYQRMVATLRNAGIRAELYLGSGKMGPQLKYADKRGSPCVVIQGSDEKAKGEVQIKDLIEGAKAAAAIASNQEWRASRPAQFAVAEANLVDAVREILTRQNVHWNV